jgi:hypothetical protein
MEHYHSDVYTNPTDGLTMSPGSLRGLFLSSTPWKSWEMEEGLDFASPRCCSAMETPRYTQATTESSNIIGLGLRLKTYEPYRTRLPWR